MERFDLADFSGGISEQYRPEGFSERQWAKLKGFIVDTDYTLRSQWAAQSVGTVPDGAIAVHGFSGNENSYIVALDSNGNIWWAIAPAEGASYTTANATTWTRLQKDKDLNAIASSVYYRFLCEILLPIENVGEVNGLLLNCAYESSDLPNAIAIYENDSYDPNIVDDTNPKYYRLLARQWDRRYPVDQPNLIDPFVGETKNTTTAKSYPATTSWSTVPTFTGGGTVWTLANDGKYPVEVRIDGTSTLLATVDSYDSYTHTSALTEGQSLEVRSIGGDSDIRLGITLGTYPLARRDVMPRGNVGIMWRNRLVIGDIKKRKNANQDWEGNQKRAPYALYYSEVEPDSFREQAILFAGSGESQIVGMHVLDDYLITISSAEMETDGLRIFRGTLDYLRLQDNEVTLNVNVLRGGVGPSHEPGIATENLSPSCVWPEAGVVAFLDAKGGIWYTDGVEVDRLDRTGPEMPDSTDYYDEVAALGKYLYVWRNERLLVLNIMSGVQGETATAAWTEISLPDGMSVHSMCPVRGSMYFISDGVVWRFAMTRNNGADTERGTFDGVPVPLTIASATVGSNDKHAKVNWFNVGARARGRATNSKVISVKSIAGPALDTGAPSYTVDLDRDLDERDELVVKTGIGSRTEASAEIVFEGDVQVESVSFWTSGLKASRPRDGYIG